LRFEINIYEYQSRTRMTLSGKALPMMCVGIYFSASCVLCAMLGRRNWEISSMREFIHYSSDVRNSSSLKSIRQDDAKFLHGALRFLSSTCRKAVMLKYRRAKFT